MKTLNLPSYQFSFKEENKKTKIFDAIRKKFLVLTPEEWVRQNVVRFLVEEKGFPANLIAIEMGLKLNGMQKRADILVYSKLGKPILLAECKAPHVKIDQNVFDQIGRYNITFKLPYLLVTNGMEHFCAQIDFNSKDFSFLQEIPEYEKLEA
ncbi:type I restriction enzyme HsdR N-terminal domain-containing protein [Vicingaceae bacterium]|nr:type I restriction enzyme HsdR N-terminal domain-containing protein [Vicingaceae bacterium]MDB4082734.1 type I restriction enzyme HsdR N-terminal domain-containing protein [Vicingaceae bacterium]MDC1450980.1 type I restriction enzyme HsdR N-terminal domain-containing protein [Vicingaceae bacterium]